MGSGVQKEHNGTDTLGSLRYSIIERVKTKSRQVGRTTSPEILRQIIVEIVSGVKAEEISRAQDNEAETEENV